MLAPLQTVKPTIFWGTKKNPPLTHRKLSDGHDECVPLLWPTRGQDPCHSFHGLNRGGSCTREVGGGRHTHTHTRNAGFLWCWILFGWRFTLHPFCLKIMILWIVVKYIFLLKIEVSNWVNTCVFSVPNDNDICTNFNNSYLVYLVIQLCSASLAPRLVK